MATISLKRTTDFSGFSGNSFTSFTGISSSSDGTVIYVILSGIGIIKSIDNGANWTKPNTPAALFSSVSCSNDGNTVFIVTSQGAGIFKTTDGLSNAGGVSFNTDQIPGGVTNPESSASGIFPSTTLNDISQIATDSTGNILIATTIRSAAIYRSTDGGVTWSFKYPNVSSTPLVHNTYNASDKRPFYIASNSSGAILYAATNEDPGQAKTRIIRSTDSGNVWTEVNTNGLITDNVNSIATNASGNAVFVSKGNKLYIFYPNIANKVVTLTPSGLNTIGPIAMYNDGVAIITAQNASDLVTPDTAGPTAVSTYSITVPCFKEGTKILCLKDEKEVYIKIEDIKNGDLVKTVKNGYLPVYMIGKKDIFHPATEYRNNEQLYKCSSAEYPEIFEDLVITGSHCILVDSFINEEQRQETIKVLGRIFVTDGKYRLPACVDNRSSVYEKEGTYKIYHFALENENILINHGIWANGLLVETCSKKYMKCLFDN
jgi:photosystem II stability/assembly factor-like uncharacterized protein